MQFFISRLLPAVAWLCFTLKNSVWEYEKTGRLTVNTHFESNIFTVSPQIKPNITILYSDLSALSGPCSEDRLCVV